MSQGQARSGVNPGDGMVRGAEDTNSETQWASRPVPDSSSHVINHKGL